MTAFELDLSLIFLITVILIWFMIAYQFALTFFGFVNYLKSFKEKKNVDRQNFVYPSCTILIPAHNEEKVIDFTIESMLNLDYPKNKLKIIIINDGSTDNTKMKVEKYLNANPHLCLFDVPEGLGGKGKSRALNSALSQVDSDVIAIYDADNTPDKNSLKYLVSQLIQHKELGAVLGKFRTVNKSHNLLTKFINIETLSFQSMLQAGRWQINNIATLPGTNYVMWTHLIKSLNGWDEEALTEDSELSIRIYQKGYKIKFIPYAITYEQEPQEWKVWIRQRLRWVRGNHYVLAKFFKQIPSFKNKLLALDLLYNLALYYIFFFAILISDFLFIISILGLANLSLPGPYTTVWIMAFILFIFEIILAISYDEEDSLKKAGIIILMYFTYCQLWIYIVLKSFYVEYIKKEKNFWEKTIRFDIAAEKKQK